MDMQLLASTALVTTQVNRQLQPSANAPGTISSSLSVAPTASGDVPEDEALQAPTTEAGGGTAVLRQSAPNSALTTYRDQDSGRLIVRVYDRESGDVLVEFPPERAFRPAGIPVSAPTAKPKTSIPT